LAELAEDTLVFLDALRDQELGKALLSTAKLDRIAERLNLDPAALSRGETELAKPRRALTVVRKGDTIVIDDTYLTLDEALSLAETLIKTVRVDPTNLL
jgi:transcriptional regulator with XRE-family HTH domain